VAPGAAPQLAVVIGPQPPELERLAAAELCGYLEKLFGVHLQPTDRVPETAAALFLVGQPATNPAVRDATAGAPWPRLSAQGLVLRRVRCGGRPALLLGGGSPVATLWAVYELAERWGVRYLLHGDVLPAVPAGRAPAFAAGPEAAGLDVAREPLLPVRQWRVVNDFACGPESWGIADYRPVLAQLAKLRFNRILVSLYPYQPFLRLEVRGIRRQQAHLWYDFHYPITDDMVGRELFGDEEEFWNPDLPRHAPYEELAAAGEQHVHQLIACARQHGMQAAVTATLMEFPPEFAPLLPGAQPVHQLGQMSVGPGPDTDVDDPALAELAAAVLRTTVDTYPEADFLVLGMPEFRQWSAAHARAWQALDSRYGIERVCPLAEVLAAARQRRDYPGGAERALQEVQGDIVALHFFDRLLGDPRLLGESRRPDMRLVFADVAEELLPVLARIAPAGAEALHFIDYTPSRIVRRRAALARVPARSMPSSLIYTLHDDNVGLLPQLTTGSLHELTVELRRHGWAGFSTRYWLVGDHDPCVAYLARAAWDASATPGSVYRDLIRAAGGEAVVEELLAVFREVEAVTVGLEWHGLGLTFPVPGMMLKHWTAEPMPAALDEDRAGYQRALAAARQALARLEQQSGAARTTASSWAEYWIGRLEFGIGYLDTIAAVRRAARAEADRKLDEARQRAQTALATARQAVAAYARVARDRADLGAIAVLNEYVCRPLQARAAELRH